jgi:hypothetical protein
MYIVVLLLCGCCSYWHLESFGLHRRDNICGRYRTVQYSMVRYGTVQYGTVQYCTVRCGAAQHGTTHCHFCMEEHG